jgi:hypothetical protein
MALPLYRLCVDHRELSQRSDETRSSRTVPLQIGEDSVDGRRPWTRHLWYQNISINKNINKITLNKF